MDPRTQGVPRYPMPPPRPFPTGTLLLIALLAGVLVGVALALASIFYPGLLPAVPVR